MTRVLDWLDQFDPDTASLCLAVIFALSCGLSVFFSLLAVALAVRL